MARLQKENFPENVHDYVDKTKPEILDSLSQIITDNDQYVVENRNLSNNIEALHNNNAILIREGKTLSKDYIKLYNYFKYSIIVCLILFVIVCILAVKIYG